ncbi:hypothetical protein ACN20G_15930 [Streptomyces sp. BI20]|uniref:hypothetical protein n=1 Tax=Streptomyces sp. BI20 TaxID=3403460 RepID=UPI003C713A96
MRIRSAITASVLAAGIMLGGAGAALATDGVSIDEFSAGRAAGGSTCSSFAGVPARIGPVYADSCEKGFEKEWATGAHLGTGH